MKLRAMAVAVGAFLSVAAVVPVVSGEPGRDNAESAVAAGPYRDLPTISVDDLARPAFESWSGLSGKRGHRIGGAGRISGLPESDEPVRSPDWGTYDHRAPVPVSNTSVGRLEIRLQQGHFDPDREGMPLLPALAGETRGDPDSDYRLIQFEGPIRSEWRSDLERRGIEIMDYVPDFAYIVRVSSERTDTLASIDGVRWVGPFAPAFRLSTSLVEQALDGRSDQWLELTMRGFAGESGDDLRSALEAIGVRIDRQGKDTGGGVIFEGQAPESALLAIASTRAVAWIEPKVEFVLANSVARSGGMTGKDPIEGSYGLFGASQIVMVVDSGLSTGNPATVHADFSGRVLAGATGGGSCAGWEDTNGHGTHVAGSVLGSGARSGSNAANGQYAETQAGIAPQAGLVVWSACDDFTAVPVDPYGALWGSFYGFHDAARTSNNSWGSINSPGLYSPFSRETDRFIRDYQDMVVVFAAGNDGVDQDMNGVSDLGTVSPPSTSKNVISVGASENYRSNGGFNPGGGCASYGQCWPDDFPAPPLAYDPLSDNPNGMAAFSGRGPTRSNRLKPDISAPGTNVVSALSELANPSGGWGPGNQYYYFQGGTSMASPLVTGGAAIVRDFFANFYQYNPSAALVKAVLLNGAYDMSPGQYGVGAQQDVWARPDINQGWGTMYLPDTLFTYDTVSHAYFENYPGLQTGQQWQTQITIEAGGESLGIMMVWIDAPGTEASHGALVNDLDLELVDPSGTVHYGFAGIQGQQRDRFNNLEAVNIASAAPGTYTIRVKGHNVPSGPQPFSMAVRGYLADNDVIFANGFEPGG